MWNDPFVSCGGSDPAKYPERAHRTGVLFGGRKTEPTQYTPVSTLPEP